MRESINRGCAWVMVVVGIGALLAGIAGVVAGELRPEDPVFAFWSLVLFFGVYVLFFKKPKESSSNPLLSLLIVLLLLTGLAILVSLLI